VGETACNFVLAAYTTASNVAVSFGGLKLSATLDGQLRYSCDIGKDPTEQHGCVNGTRTVSVSGGITVNATDLRTGTYSIALPPQRVGKHTVVISNGGQVLGCAISCLNPITLNVHKDPCCRFLK